MTLNRRLDKIERAFTPKQAVILWLQEVQQYPNALEYARFLRGQPETAAPLYRITKQISETVRESMKGQPQQCCGKHSISGCERRVFPSQTPTTNQWLSDDGRENLEPYVRCPGRES